MRIISGRFGLSRSSKVINYIFNLKLIFEFESFFFFIFFLIWFDARWKQKFVGFVSRPRLNITESKQPWGAWISGDKGDLGEHDHVMIFIWISLCSILALIWFFNDLRQRHQRRRSQNQNRKWPSAKQIYAAKLLRDGMTHSLWLIGT